jgi:hypothetical protein
MELMRRRNIVRAMLISVMTLAAMIGAGSQASAASGSASGTGVSASAMWDWRGTASIIIYYRYVEDTACDQNDVRMYLRVYRYNGSDIVGSLRNSDGCNHGVGNLDEVRWDSNFNITKVRVTACVDDFGEDTCYWKDVDNPNT